MDLSETHLLVASLQAVNVPGGMGCERWVSTQSVDLHGDQTVCVDIGFSHSHQVQSVLTHPREPQYCVS